MNAIFSSKNITGNFYGRILALIPAILLFILTGCAGMKSKWVCEAPPCLQSDRAVDKCLVKVGESKFATLKQCMSGEGFKQVLCADHERENEECQFTHAW